MNSGDPSQNTLFLRLEGPLQSWGDPSKFVIRRTMDAPTKSGIIGLICSAMGQTRQGVTQYPVPDEALQPLAARLVVRREKDENEPRRALLDLLNTLRMGVRIDRSGVRWWDYHTVGAGTGMTTASGNLKTGAQGTLIKRLEYLADASFLVALQGDHELIALIAQKIARPEWPLFLGRKSCPPSVPVLCKAPAGESWANPMTFPGGLKAALAGVPWHPRCDNDELPIGDELPCLIEWLKSDGAPVAPAEAEVWYDVPFSFAPQAHHPRLVMREHVTVEVGTALQQRTPAPPRPRADYSNADWTSETLIDVTDPNTGQVTKEPRGMRPRRLRRDQGLCVFCKSPASTVQHLTYRRAGGDETQEDLRSLCRLCHDAVTMIEYGAGMGLDRINPEDPQYRDEIIQNRREIIAFRSLETRRRRLDPEEIE